MRRALVALALSLFAAAVFAQSADQQVVSATDSPDPVVPGNNVTYTVVLRNNGPDPAVNGGLNVNFDNNLTFLLGSSTIPAGFSCGQFGQAVTCNTPSFTASSQVTFTLVATLSANLLNFPDGSISTLFSTSGVTPDPNNGNNSANVTTAYDSPQVNLGIAVADSPDPVGPDGDITYTATVTQTGPDTATSVNFNLFNNNSLRFRSATIPAGWNCTLPAVDGNPTFTCTKASVPTGTNDVFTVVLRAYQSVLGVNDGTVSASFSVNGTGNETNTGNNLEQEDTSYVAPDADMQITASDSPDPVAPDGDITYTVTVTNAGPDPATNAILNVPMNNTLRVTSVNPASGWTCSNPGFGGGTSWSCTRASFPINSPSTFIIVLRANDEQFGINDQTIVQNFSAVSSTFDPSNGNNSVNVSTSYSTPDADMQITASDSPDPVTNGANLTYTITVTNAGPDAGPNAQMIASPHPSLTFQSLTAPAGWTCTTPAVNAAGVTQCSNPSLANGANANFTLVVKLVTAGSGGTLQSTFSTSSGAQDPNNVNNQVTVNTTWVGQTSDLSITKSTLATAAAQGGTITYTLSTSNAGPDAASNVTVTDVLPAQLLFQSLTAPAGWTCTTPAVGANGTVSCTIASFGSGASANFTLVTTVASNATGTVSNTATIGFTGGSDPTPGNASGTGNGVLIGGNADLGVTKTTAAANVAPGGSLSYTISVTNNGPDAAASVVMTDVLPASLLFQSITAPAGWSCTTPAVGANGTVTCNAATLASGATATFTLNTTVATGATGTITNTATASHSGSDGTPGNNGGSSPATPIVVSDADLALAKTAGATSVTTGGTLTWTITVTNNGPAGAANVVVTDTLPTGTTFLSATPSQGSCSGTTTVTCNLGTLSASAVATITLNVTVTATSGTITNSATVSSSTSDPNGGNNTGTTIPVPVTPSAVAEEEIPTLSEWALIALALLIAAFAARRLT